MSRSNPVEKIESPVDHYYNWFEEGGNFSEPLGEGEFKEIPYPIKLVVLDHQVAQIKGKNRKSHRRINSNYARTGYGTNPIFRVKYTDSGEVIGEGLWRDIKPVVSGHGGKYTVKLFGMTAKKKIVCVHLKGEVLRSFNVFEKTVNLDGNFIMEITGNENAGNEEFPHLKTAVFGVKPFDNEVILEAAKEADVELQKFLKDRFDSLDQDTMPGEDDEPVNGKKKEVPEPTVELDLKDLLLEQAGTVDNYAVASVFWKEAVLKMETNDFTLTEIEQVRYALQENMDRLYMAGNYEVDIAGGIQAVEKKMAADVEEDDLPF